MAAIPLRPFSRPAEDSSLFWGNVAAVMVQEVGDAAKAVATAPRRGSLQLSIERSASMPMEGKGVFARWDADDESLQVYSSTQTSTSVRQAIAAKLGLPVDRVEVIAPDVGGGFGVKIVHPWPEEVLVPWAAIRLGRPQLAPDVRADPDYVAALPGVVSELAVPLRSGRSVVGILNVESERALPDGAADALRRLLGRSRL